MCNRRKQLASTPDAFPGIPVLGRRQIALDNLLQVRMKIFSSDWHCLKSTRSQYIHWLWNGGKTSLQKWVYESNCKGTANFLASFACLKISFSLSWKCHLLFILEMPSLGERAHQWGQSRKGAICMIKIYPQILVQIETVALQYTNGSVEQSNLLLEIWQ